MGSVLYGKERLNKNWMYRKAIELQCRKLIHELLLREVIGVVPMMKYFRFVISKLDIIVNGEKKNCFKYDSWCYGCIQGVMLSNIKVSLLWRIHQLQRNEFTVRFFAKAKVKNHFKHQITLFIYKNIAIKKFRQIMIFLEWNWRTLVLGIGPLDLIN